MAELYKLIVRFPHLEGLQLLFNGGSQDLEGWVVAESPEEAAKLEAATAVSNEPPWHDEEFVSAVLATREEVTELLDFEPTQQVLLGVEEDGTPIMAPLADHIPA